MFSKRHVIFIESADSVFKSQCTPVVCVLCVPSHAIFSRRSPSFNSPYRNGGFALPPTRKKALKWLKMQKKDQQFVKSANNCQKMRKKKCNNKKTKRCTHKNAKSTKGTKQTKRAKKVAKTFYCNRAIIRTGREIQCPPYAGFFNSLAVLN